MSPSIIQFLDECDELDSKCGLCRGAPCRDPNRLVSEISKLGLRHVGFGTARLAAVLASLLDRVSLLRLLPACFGCPEKGA